MLSIFRKIRKSFFEPIPSQQEGDSARKSASPAARYVFYAIGEIALVVVGILIALQINNANEIRKERDFEVKMLNEIREQLILDTGYFNMLVQRITRIDTSVQHILEFLETGSTDLEYLKYHSGNIRHGYIFEYHGGAYDALKSSGIEKVSNNDLRLALIELYDFSFPRTKHILATHRSPSHIAMEEEMEGFIFGYKIRKNEVSGRSSIGYDTIDWSIVDDPIFMKYLEMKYTIADEGLDRIGRIMKKVEGVLILLNKELEE